MGGNSQHGMEFSAISCVGNNETLYTRKSKACFSLLKPHLARCLATSPPPPQIPLGNSSPRTNTAAHEQDASSREEAIPICTARQPSSGGVEGRHSAPPKSSARQHTPPSGRPAAQWGAQARNIVNASGTDAGLIRYAVRNRRAFGIDALIRCPAAAIR